jgi:hypothetical protein
MLLVQYILASEIWKLDPTDTRERTEWLARLRSKHLIPPLK